MKRRRFSLEVRPGAVVLLSGLYFLLPLRWCARLALTVTVHELGHVAALILCGAEVCGLRMEGCGLVLRCTPTEGALRTVTAALAGPAAGAGLFCILRGLGYIACAELSLLFSCVNLLPVLPLDGGRILLGLMTMLFGARTGERIAYRISIAITVLLLIAGTVLAFNNGSKAPAAAAIWLMLAQRNGGAELFKEKEC